MRKWLGKARRTTRCKTILAVTVGVICCLAGTGLAVGLSSDQASWGKNFKWEPCLDAKGHKLKNAECTSVTVPLDHSGKTPRTISLRVARSTSHRNLPVLLHLGGGPGYSNIDQLFSRGDSIKALSNKFTVLTFDYRGTGSSSALECPELGYEQWSANAAEASCVAKLGKDRAFYTTRDTAKDIELIRLKLAVNKVSIYGESYGTRVALRYASTHNGSIEKIVLESVFDPTDADIFQLRLRKAQRESLKRLCPNNCHDIGDPVAQIGKLYQKLKNHPLHGQYFDHSGKAQNGEIKTSDLYSLISLADHFVQARASLPSAVWSALHYGDAAPLLRLTSLQSKEEGDSTKEYSGALNLTIDNEENPKPWSRGAPIEKREQVVETKLRQIPASAFAPFDAEFARDGIHGLKWPELSAPQSSAPGSSTNQDDKDWTKIDRPVLILQGSEDTRTFPEMSADVQRSIRGAQRVMVNGIGHEPANSACAQKQIDSFFAGKPVKTVCDAGKVPAISQLAPMSIKGVPPIGEPSLPAKTRKTLRAIQMTVRDGVEMYEMLSSVGFCNASFGGLRGGTAKIGCPDAQEDITFTDYEYIPGVKISGKPVRKGWNIRVTGASIAPGDYFVTRDTQSVTVR